MIGFTTAKYEYNAPEIKKIILYVNKIVEKLLKFSPKGDKIALPYNVRIYTRVS